MAIGSEGCELKDKDLITFVNFKDCEFMYYDNCDNIPSGAKKRKLSDM